MSLPLAPLPRPGGLNLAPLASLSGLPTSSLPSLSNMSNGLALLRPLGPGGLAPLGSSTGLAPLSSSVGLAPLGGSTGLAPLGSAGLTPLRPLAAQPAPSVQISTLSSQNVVTPMAPTQPAPTPTPTPTPAPAPTSAPVVESVQPVAQPLFQMQAHAAPALPVNQPVQVQSPATQVTETHQLHSMQAAPASQASAAQPSVDRVVDEPISNTASQVNQADNTQSSSCCGDTDAVSPQNSSQPAQLPSTVQSSAIVQPQPANDNACADALGCGEGGFCTEICDFHSDNSLFSTLMSCLKCELPMCTEQTSTRLANFARDCQHVLLNSQQLVIDETAVNKLVDQALKRHFTDRAQQKDDVIFTMTVRGCDELELDKNVQHPLVRVHLVDVTNGTAWTKKDADRPVLYHTEASRHSSRILSAQTSPYSFVGTGTSACRWNEDLVYNEPVAHILLPNAMFLFEVMEFGPKVKLEQYPDGLRPLCWGFLKVMSSRGRPNFGPSRIQLYQYVHDLPKFHLRSHTPRVYYQYLYHKNIEQIKYTSTLSIELRAHVAQATQAAKGARPQSVLEQEQSSISFADLWKQAQNKYAATDGGPAVEMSMGGSSVVTLSMHESRMRRRTRTAGEPCRAPDQFCAKVSCAQNGVCAAAFSPDGKYVAVACAEYTMFPIKLYETTSFGLVFSFTGHHNYIYDLQWSADSKSLLTASSDQTANVWDFDNRRPNETLVLPHASFVYAAQFHPKLPLIVTGCYDGSVSLFSMSGVLLASFYDHALQSQPSISESTSVPPMTPSVAVRSVNSLCFSADGDRLFSVDYAGYLRVWHVRRDLMLISEEKLCAADFDIQAACKTYNFYKSAADKSDASKSSGDLALLRCVKLISHSELVGNVLCKVKYTQYGGERIAVVCRNNAVYLFNGYTLNLRHKLTGAQCELQNMPLTFSADGTRLLMGSEDGKAYTWNCSTGMVEAALDVGFNQDAPVSALSWHPTQNLVCYGAFGQDHPLIYFERDSEQQAVIGRENKE